jgi:hypothetical protein
MQAKVAALNERNATVQQKAEAAQLAADAELEADIAAAVDGGDAGKLTAHLEVATAAKVALKAEVSQLTTQYVSPLARSPARPLARSPWLTVASSFFY